MVRVVFFLPFSGFWFSKVARGPFINMNVLGCVVDLSGLHKIKDFFNRKANAEQRKELVARKKTAGKQQKGKRKKGGGQSQGGE